jgi:hypothetical protein
MNEVVVQKELSLDPSEFIDVLNRSTLGERRPVAEFSELK